jgi:parallel beta-helix repeat protein
MFFPSFIDFFNTINVENNYHDNVRPLGQEKFASIQASPIVITSNSEFIAAGFYGFGTHEEPYILKGISIDAGGPTAINITNTVSYFRIENVGINGSINTGAAGVYLENVTNGHITGTIVTNCYDGMKFVNSTITVEDNTISSTTASGIYHYEGSYTSIINNIFTSTGSHAIYFKYSDYNNITGNIITNTGSYAIYLGGYSKYNNITANTIQVVAGYGIRLYEYNRNNLIADNTITNTTSTGISLYWGGDGNTVTGNTISNAGGHGLWIGWYSVTNKILDNNITDAALSGILINTVCYNGIIRGNIITRAGERGILIDNVGNTGNLIERNTIFNCTGYGVEFTTSVSGHTVSWNTFLDNNQGGIQGYDNGSSNTFSNNYWNDWTSPDNDSDMIVDTPYAIDGDVSNSDPYPLVHAVRDTTAIVISSNTGLNGFEVAGFTGNGTVDAPYVLDEEYYYAEGAPAITILNTDAYFCIANVTITGSTDPDAGGIKLLNVMNGRIVTTRVIENYHGFYLEDSENITLTGNEATDNAMSGFFLTGTCKNITLEDNTASDNIMTGFFLTGTSKNITLEDNIATVNGQHGILVDECGFNNFSGNTVNSNGQNGFSLEDSSYNTVSGNNVTGNIMNGFFLTGTSSYNTLEENDASENGQHGILVDRCGFNNLTGNTINANSQNGLSLENSYNNTLVNCTAISNSETGFFLGESYNNSLISNIAGSNDDKGFLLSGADDNGLEENTASDNAIGYYLDKSNNNTLTGNFATNNSGQGVFLVLSSDNLVYYNFFIVNNLGGIGQGSDISGSNSWTNTTHGNYWSDYTGEDTDGDGIGDTANYTLGVDVEDTKPLVFYSLIDLSTLQVTGPGDAVIEAGSVVLHSITWLPATNFIPTGYIIYKNGEQIDFGSWITGIAIQLNVNAGDLSMDTEYNFTLSISDHSDKTITHTVLITVKDTTPPDFHYIGPDELTFEEGSTNGTLVFTFMVSDLYIDTFTLYQDDNAIFSWKWPPETSVRIITDGIVNLVYADTVNEGFTTITGSIKVNLVNLDAGAYDFVFTVNDTSGNDVSASITVTVTPSSTTSETAPGWSITITVLSLVILSSILFNQRRRKKKCEMMRNGRVSS